MAKRFINLRREVAKLKERKHSIMIRDISQMSDEELLLIASSGKRDPQTGRALDLSDAELERIAAGSPFVGLHRGMRSDGAEIQ